MPWLSLLGKRQAWAYMVAKFLTDPVWWFYLIWLPDYFKKEQHLDLKHLGTVPSLLHPFEFIGWMFSQPLVVLYSIVTVLTFAIFLGIIWWAMSRRNQANFDEAAQLPFRQDD